MGRSKLLSKSQKQQPCWERRAATRWAASTCVQAMPTGCLSSALEALASLLENCERVQMQSDCTELPRQRGERVKCEQKVLAVPPAKQQQGGGVEHAN